MYKEIDRVTLINDYEDRKLVLILETNDVSWKLFARVEAPGEAPRNSGWWSFTKLERAKTALKDRVEDAEEKGWKREGE